MRASVPENFVITLPKVTVAEQVTALVRLLEAMERKLGLRAGALRMELMIETTQSVIDADGCRGDSETAGGGRGPMPRAALRRL